MSLAEIDLSCLLTCLFPQINNHSVALLLSALKMLPTINGTVFRGVRLPVEICLGADKVVGSKVTWWAFSSSTASSDVRIARPKPYSDNAESPLLNMNLIQQRDTLFAMYLFRWLPNNAQVLQDSDFLGRVVNNSWSANVKSFLRTPTLRRQKDKKKDMRKTVFVIETTLGVKISAFSDKGVAAEEEEEAAAAIGQSKANKDTSVQANEDEVMLLPGSTFEITSIKDLVSTPGLVEVKMKDYSLSQH